MIDLWNVGVSKRLSHATLAVDMLYCIAILSILLPQVLSQPLTCTLGSNATLPNPPLRRSGISGLLIDLGNRAKCNGTMTAWDYCAHSALNRDQATRYSATFVVFRRIGSDPNQYSAVQGSMAQLRLNVSSDPVTCGSLNLRNQIRVEEGDIVGACVVTQSRNLGVVSTDSTTPTEVYLSQQCQRNNLMDINIANNFNLRRVLVLHLSTRLEGDPTDRPSPSIGNGTGGGGGGGGGSGGDEGGGGGDTAQGGLAGGAVAGIVLVVLVGVIVTIAIIAVLLSVFCLKRRQQNLALGSTPKENLYKQSEGSEAKLETSNKKIPIKPSRPPPISVKVARPQPPPSSQKTASDDPERHCYAELGPTEAQYADLLEKNVKEDLYKSVDHYKHPASNKDALYSQLKACGIKTIQRASIKVLKHLGSGQFGSVELGEWNNGGTTKVDVALKTLYKGASTQDTITFLQEAAIMAQFKHPNVIKLHGVVSVGEPIVLVVELADCDLLAQLDRISERLQRDKQAVSEIPPLLLKFSQQIGLGMQYLSAKGFIHRDLAARNILVKRERICKIADFGMSRNLDKEEVYVSSGGKIPLKWTAPEAIFYKRYSTASDVWSYGCVLYEIWSLGIKPFGNEANQQVVELVKSGFRLPPPPGCPKTLYKTMIHTWNPSPEQRPNFRDAVLGLVGDRQQILNIPSPDLRSHPEAGTLGADLEAGMFMYKDLQDSYR